jgi:tetratricopeptide (TPR) repeat protein
MIINRIKIGKKILILIIILGFLLISINTFTFSQQGTDPAEVFVIEGNQLAQQGYLEEAIKRYDYALELSPDNLIALISRALVRSMMWEYIKAIEDFTELIKKDPYTDTNYLERGLCYIYIGSIDKAIKDWDKSIELKPEDNPAYMYRACVYKIVGEEEKFKADYEIAIKNYRSEAYFYNKIAQFIGFNQHPQLYDIDLAFEYATKAFEMTGGRDVDVLYTMGELYFQRSYDRETDNINKYDLERAISYMSNIFQQQNYLKIEMNGYYIYRYYTMKSEYDKLNGGN